VHSAERSTREPKVRWCQRVSKQQRRTRERIRDKAQQMLRDMGKPDDPRLA
jgi:hypothetical protein